MGLSKSPSGLMCQPTNSGHGSVADDYSVQTKEVDVKTLFFPTSLFFLLCIMPVKIPASAEINSFHLCWKIRSAIKC